MSESLFKEYDETTDWGWAIMAGFTALIGVLLGPFMLIGLPILLSLILPDSQRLPGMLACIPAYVIGAAFTAESIQMLFGKKRRDDEAA